MKNWLLAVLATYALLVTACSDDDATSGGDGAPACTITPTAEVRTTLAEPNVAEPTSDTRNPSVNVCSYAEGELTAKVLIRYEIDITDESWAVEKKGFNDNGQPTTDVAGVGDEAFTSALSLGASTFTSLVARKGSRGVQIVSTSSPDQIKTLAISIVGRL